MAERHLYPLDADAVVDGDRLEVLGASAGPAGVSSVELPDGSVWQVDHINPAVLVDLDVDAADPAGSPLLIAAFGGDGAMFLVDRALPVDGLEAHSVAGGSRRLDVSSMQSGPKPDVPAEQAGRMVVLADLADDTDLHPLARVAATVELHLSVRQASVGPLVQPLIHDLLDRADALCDDIDDIDVGLLDPQHAVRLSTAVGDASGVDDGLRPALRRLAEGLRVIPERPRRALSRLSAPMVSFDEDLAPPLVQAERPRRRGDLDIERVTPTLARITTTRADTPRWVRVQRRDGLVLLALASLHRDGLLDSADVAVPPDAANDDLLIEFIRPDDVPVGAVGPIGLVRAAVRVGRNAARSERLGDRPDAARQWRICADLWDQAGDHRRAMHARDLASYGTPRIRRPFMADAVTRSIDTD